MTATTIRRRVVRVSSPVSDTLAIPQAPAPATDTPHVSATVPVLPLRRASRKFTRARPGDEEQERREAWGRKWGALNRAAINQAMEGQR